MPDNHFDRVYMMREGHETKAHYNQWAATYDADLTGSGYAQPVRTAETLERIGIASSASILDVGCGTGLSGVAIARAGFAHLDGCDYSTGMLEVAAETSAYGRLFEADLNDPPIDVVDDFYDVATMVGVFGFGHVHPEALEEVLRVVAPGGAIVIAVNENFYDDGGLPAKIAELEERGAIGPALQEHGDHIPGRDVSGWVISARKASS